MAAETATRPGLASRGLGLILRGMIRAYQLLISPVLPGTCRYLPSCSSYAIDAVAQHGPLKGGALALWRILRCNPWGGAGYDPVPPTLCHHHERGGDAKPPTKFAEDF